MLHVLCHIGRDAYAIPCQALEHVLPFAALKALPGAEQGIAGLLNYRGCVVPVVDLCLALTREPAREVRGTRILLCACEEAAAGKLGLLVEGVSQAVSLDEKDFRAAGAEAAPCLDGVQVSEKRLIQRMELKKILPPGVLAGLGLAPAASIP